VQAKEGWEASVRASTSEREEAEGGEGEGAAAGESQTEATGAKVDAATAERVKGAPATGGKAKAAQQEMEAEPWERQLSRQRLIEQPRIHSTSHTEAAAPPVPRYWWRLR